MTYIVHVHVHHPQKQQIAIRTKFTHCVTSEMVMIEPSQLEKES